jgi:hypothetical protein
MKKINYIFFLLAIILLTGCPVDRDYFIRIQNNSSTAIYACAWYVLPDTLLPINKPHLVEIKSNKTGNIHGYQINDDTFSRLQHERLTIFILSKDVVDTNSWEYLRNNNLIIKRYEGNAEELPRDNGLSIHYP